MQSHATPQLFESAVRVSPADIDGQDHVNNVVYLRWAQEVATAHWESLAPPEAQAALGWVVLRHEIDYKAAAILDDELLVRTWVGALSGISFERFTEIVRKTDRRLLAQVRTLWVPIDPRSGKPKRVSAEVRGIFAIAAGADT